VTGQIESREALDNLIAALPPVPEGYVRVFRGQTRDHASLVPSAFRDGKKDNRLLRVVVQMQASELRGEGAGGNAFTEWLVWSQGLAQHYGVGSEYLDVTKDLDVALWFALHPATVATGWHVFGPPGPFDPPTDYPMAYPWTSYPDEPGDTGVLYVFALPLWREGKVAHGQLIDLATAPSEFANLRVSLQHGCLVASEKDLDGGDLSAFAMAQIDVRSTISGRWQALAAGDFFPGVEADPWLRHFVSVPLAFRPDEAMVLQPIPTLPIEFHVTSPEAFDQITSRLILLPSPVFAVLVREVAEGRMEWNPPVISPPTNYVAILDDFPDFLMTPEIGSGVWNESVLFAQLPTSAPVTGILASVGETVDLSNVFLEFSDLERGFWHEVETSGKTYTHDRGIFVARSGSTFRLWFYSQVLPKGPSQCAGYLEVCFDEDEQVFKLNTGDGLNRKALESLPKYHKQFLVALTLLRELSERPLPVPFPTLWTTNDYYVFNTQSGGSLIKTVEPKSGTIVHVLKRSVQRGMDIVQGHGP
jgi:hypothetical protein